MSAPLPRANLPKRQPDLITVPPGSVVHRFYTAKYDPIFFDTSRDGRLNAPDRHVGIGHESQIAVERLARISTLRRYS